MTIQDLSLPTLIRSIKHFSIFLSSMPNILDNKRILKNTLALYFRQIVTMCISLYTSRLVLRELGVEDYGINAVVVLKEKWALPIKNSPNFTPNSPNFIYNSLK